VRGGEEAKRDVLVFHARGEWGGKGDVPRTTARVHARGLGRKINGNPKPSPVGHLRNVKKKKSLSRLTSWAYIHSVKGIEGKRQRKRKKIGLGRGRGGS